MMRSLRTVLLIAPVLALFVVGVMPRPGGTLPLFARKYSMPCSSCHAPFPRLNSFGMQFRQNGYRMQGAKGESPWDSQSFPLSLVGNVGYGFVSTDTIDTTDPNRARVRTNLGQFQQNAVEFHTAGTLAEKITFHFDNGFATETGVLESGMAFIQFDDLVKDGVLNLKAGIYDAEIPYLSSARRTTLHDYLAPVTLDGRGLELNGVKSGWSYAAGLVNSDRTRDSTLAHTPGVKTFNQLENVYLWLMRDVKGQLVTARVFFDRQDPHKADASASLHLQAELSALLSRGPLLVIPGYTFEQFSDQDVRDKIHTGLLEALVLLGKDQRWALTARYEHQYLPKTDLSPLEDHGVGVLNLAYCVNPNAKVALDWAHTSDNLGGPRLDELQAYVHVGY